MSAFARNAFVFTVLIAAPALAGAGSTYSAGTPDYCLGYQRHIPAEDVHVGQSVDAEGWAIAPADLSPPAISAHDFDPVRIEVDTPLGAYWGKGDSRDLSGSELRLGHIDAYQSGDIHWNGRPLNDTATGEIPPECLSRIKLNKKD